MLIHYILLGVNPDASDETIRDRYLHLVKCYPPEKDPVRFQEIDSAYQSVKDIRRRLESRYLIPNNSPDVEAYLMKLIKTVHRKRRRATLQELIKASSMKSGSGIRGNP